MRSSSVKHVVFDFGGVLIRFNPLEFLVDLLGDEEKAERCYRLLLHSKEWESLDRGTITLQEAIWVFIEREPALREEIECFFANWYDMFQPIAPTVDLLKALHRNGVPLYAISNFMKETFEDLEPRFPFLSLFHDIVLSYRIKRVKPEPEIYRYLLDRNRLRPEECVFIDDMERNTRGAQSVGMETILYVSPEQVREKLESFNLI